MEDTKYLPELLAEKDSLDSSFTHAMKLISAGNVISCCRIEADSELTAARRREAYGVERPTEA